MRDRYLASILWLSLGAACGGSSSAARDAAPVTPDGAPAVDAAPDAAICTQTTCGSDCVDLMTSLAHCGSCDHACGCGATTCSAGVCDSNPIATAQGGPVALALNADALYWGNDTDMNVSTIALAPGATASVLFPGRTEVRGFAFDATRIYFSRFEFHIMEAALLTGASAGNYTNQQELDADGVASDATATYWTDYSAGTIRKAPHGLPVQTATTLLTGEPVPDQIAVDGDSVYWTTNQEAGTVKKMPKTGGTPVVLASGQANAHGIALDATYVYWTDQGVGGNTGSVNRVPIDPAAGTTVTTFADHLAGPSAIAVDAHDVYWTDPVAGTVMRAPLAGGAAVPVAVGEAAPMGLVVTPTCLYFADYAGATAGSGSIREHDLQ